MDLILERGGHENSVLTIAAGDGGSSSEAAAGAKGGNVTGVAVAGIDAKTIFRSVAAGNGGDGANVGGKGGSISNLQVEDHDIGLREGATYGYETMGGIFAGAGGNGTKAGLAGNVTNVTAQAIAAIVAGREAAPQLVEKVDRITLASNPGADGVVTRLLERNDLVTPNPAVKYSAFLIENYRVANLVGAVAVPTRAEANKFLWVDNPQSPEGRVGEYDLGEVPVDGLIAAKTLVRTNLNFVPEAYFNGIDLEDHDNAFSK